MATTKKTAPAPVDKMPRTAKATTVSAGKATLGKPGAPKAKRALKAIVPTKLKDILDAADPKPGRRSETDRLIGRITPAEGFNDYTVAILVHGKAEAIRQFGVQLDEVKGKRLTNEQLANEVAKLALHYENIRTASKFGRGYISITAVVVRHPQEGVKLATYSFTYSSPEVTSF